MELDEWLVQLQVRRIIRTECVFEGQVQNLRDSIRKNPIFSWDSVDSFTKATLMERLRHPWVCRSVRPMTVDDLFNVERGFDSDVRERMEAIRNGGPAEKIFLPVVDGDGQIQRDWMGEPAHWRMGGSKKALIEVDLETPNNLLIRHFKETIKELRKEDRREEIEADQFAFSPIKWGKLAVLPYLDLYQWSIENGEQIQHSLMAKWIFPGSIEVFGAYERVYGRTGKPMVVYPNSKKEFF